jgi:hypothetical protein
VEKKSNESQRVGDGLSERDQEDWREYLERLDAGG